MCGIAGFVGGSPDDCPDATVLARMAEAIAHRGPDAQGCWTGNGVGLGHRRLSIIDLSGGDQPIGNEDGTVQVVFNGEIYNYQSLRAELESRGHRFRTRSDTEVLVHLYEELGEKLVDRLRGMFAFALWDGRLRRLILSRDRVGLKPLYFCHEGRRVLFGSEIKAILAVPGVSRDIDPYALEDYLACGFVSGHRSIFRSIRKLPPGHTLVVRQQDLPSLPSPIRYWQLSLQLDETATLDDWLGRLREKFSETVRMHRLADVPIGAFLSGGVDSSAIVAELAKAGTHDLQTFSIGFHEDRFNELSHARETAKRFGTKHVEQIVTAEAASSLDELARHYDEPFADASAVPTFAVSRLARDHVKVVLSGDGGDEAFGGYSRYLHDLKEARIRGLLPRVIRRQLIRHVAAIWPKLDWLPRPLRWKSALTNLSLEPADAYARSLMITRHDQRTRLWSAKFRAMQNGFSPEAEIAARYPQGVETLHAMTHTDVGMLLPDDFLTKVDRASMAVGLEVRPPLVDHEFLELAAKIPSRFKIRDGESKAIFKEMLRDTLPGAILDRRKQGFEIPVDRWLKKDLRGVFESTVLAKSSEIAQLIDVEQTKRLYRSHLRGTGRHGGTLWALLVLGRWMDVYRPTGLCA